MNIVFSVISLVSIIMLCIFSPNNAIAVMLEGAKGGIDLAIKLCAIYTVWLSILNIMEKTNFTSFLAKLFCPLSSRLFKGESQKAHTYISMNFATNLLGMGGAATPMGIKAVEEMKSGAKASDNMILFMVINATSIQILPMTIIAMRASSGSINAGSIILPSIITTTVTTLVGILLCYVFRGGKAKANE